MKRRSRKRIPFLQSSRGLRFVLWTMVAAASIGFVRCTAIASYRERYFAPDLVHPWDYLAELCLVVVLCALFCIALTGREPPLRQYDRLTDARIWRAARTGGLARPARTRSKPRRRSSQRSS